MGKRQVALPGQLHYFLGDKLRRLVAEPVQNVVKAFEKLSK